MADWGPLRNLLLSFLSKPTSKPANMLSKSVHNGGIAIYWDVANVPPPLGRNVVETANTLRQVLPRKYGRILEFKVYESTEELTQNDFGLVRLNDARVEVVVRSHEEASDKTIIVDALWLALSNRVVESSERNPTICIISSDSGFNPLLSKLAMNGFHTLSITASQMNSKAAEHLTWADFGLNPAAAGPTAPCVAVSPLVPTARRTFVATPSAKESCDRPTVATFVEKEDYHDNLRQAILSAGEKVRQRGTGDGVFVLRSQAGIEYPKSGIPFADAVKAGIRDGILHSGATGTHGVDWISLTKPLYLLAAGPSCSFPPEPCSASGRRVCGKQVITVAGEAFQRVVYGPFPSTEAVDDFADKEAFGKDVQFFEVTSPETVFTYKVDNEPVRYTDQDLTNTFVETRGLRYIFSKPGENGQLCKFGSSCRHGRACTFLHKKIE